MLIEGGDGGPNHVNLYFKINPLGADVHFNGRRWEGPPYIARADDEEGWIEIEILDHKGMPLLIADEQGVETLHYYRLHGKVEFKGPRL